MNWRKKKGRGQREEGEEEGREEEIWVMSKTGKKNFYLSYTHVFVSLPKVQMISLLANSVTKLLASKINTGLLQMCALPWEKKTLCRIWREVPITGKQNVEHRHSPFFSNVITSQRKESPPSYIYILFPFSTFHSLQTSSTPYSFLLLLDRNITFFIHVAQASADGRNGRARGLREMPGVGTRLSHVVCLASTVWEEGRRKRKGRKKRRRKQERNWIVFRKSTNCSVLSQASPFPSVFH